MTSTYALMTSAAGIAVLHTVVGLDHTVPFVVLARAQSWTVRRMWWITFLCGVLHVLSSCVLAAMGIALGIAVQHVLGVEDTRGRFAAWFLVVAGAIYAAWGLVSSGSPRRHRHVHVAPAGTLSLREHDHRAEEAGHEHADRATIASAAMLFIVFAFGPCEFLVGPLFAAYTHGWSSVAAVAAVFAVSTIGTMLLLTTLGFYGIARIGFAFARLERHAHALAGAAIASTGVMTLLVGT